MKRFLATAAGLAVAAAASMSFAGPANAANETATVKLTMTPQSGQLSKTERSPVNWRTALEVKAPFPASPKVQPTKNVKITFPSDMSFNPKDSTPVCPDSAVGPDADLNFDPNTVIARCPKAVLGNGNAELYLAGNQNGTGPTLTDPVLIVFNGGRNSSNQPRLKIYGYSAGTGVGIYMEGALVNGVLDISIPRLSFDSAVGPFDLNIPGSNASQANRRGVDKTYVQAKCSTGTWITNATFQLGTRDSGGNPTSPTSTIQAPEDKGSCTGVVTGKGKFGSVKVKKGPGKVKKGKKGTYKVAIKNSGKGTIQNLKVTASGKGVKGSKTAGSLAKGKSKTITVKVKFSKKGKIKTKFKATGKGVNAKTATKTVKVK